MEIMVSHNFFDDMDDLAREEFVWRAVLAGELAIDSEGRVWRLAARRWDRWRKCTRVISCTPRRAENQARPYPQVRVMVNGRRVQVSAHRVVYRFFYGPIPDGMQVNHKDGDKMNNRPANLEAVTPSQNVLHALHVLYPHLRRRGEQHPMAKLMPCDVQTIIVRRRRGDQVKQIARDYGICASHASSLIAGRSWKHRLTISEKQEEVLERIAEK